MLNDFNYWLTGAGWAEVFFASDRSQLRFEFSYLSDPLADLLRSLLNMVNGFSSKAIVEFWDEPGYYQLNMQLNGENLRLEVRTGMDVEGAEDIPPGFDSLSPSFVVTDKLVNICHVVYAGVTELRTRIGEEEYLQQWINYPFPAKELEGLGLALMKS